MGLFILVFSLVVKLAFSAVAKNLAIDVGGAKRLHALSTIAAGIILLFIVLIDLIAGVRFSLNCLSGSVKLSMKL